MNQSITIYEQPNNWFKLPPKGTFHIIDLTVYLDTEDKYIQFGFPGDPPFAERIAAPMSLLATETILQGDPKKCNEEGILRLEAFGRWIRIPGDCSTIQAALDSVPVAYALEVEHPWKWLTKYGKRVARSKIAERRTCTLWPVMYRPSGAVTNPTALVPGPQEDIDRFEDFFAPVVTRSSVWFLVPRGILHAVSGVPIG